MLSDKEIVHGIASHDNKVYHYVYHEMLPYVDNYICQHGGSTEQAQDIFQDAMITVYKKIIAGKFTLYVKFSTYLFAVAKRMWIQDRKKHYLRINKLEDMQYAAEPIVPYGQEPDDQPKELLDKHFQKISPDCQKILLLYFNGLEMEEIRKEMGINTVHHATDKKYRCKKNLIERIKNDPRFRK
jgi:RNA polymerase sigma factor (sigma-70 family)